MKIAVEIYAEKLLDIKENTYFKTALMVKGELLNGSEGYDRYEFPALITSEKRVAALGRGFVYTLAAFPAGMGAIEARPGKYLDLPDVPDDVTLTLETNLILDPGMLADSLGVRLANAQGKSVDIPLRRPDIPIWWEGRGKYAIPLNEIFNSRFLRMVS